MHGVADMISSVSSMHSSLMPTICVSVDIQANQTAHAADVSKLL
jgi:hypothetical protein